MNLRRVRVIWLKELLDISRDRRALFFMVALPIAIVPVLMLGITRLMAFGQKKLLEEPSRIAILGGENAPHIVEALRAEESALAGFSAPPEVIAAKLEEAELAKIDVATEAKHLRDSGIEVKDVHLLKVVDAPAGEAAARKAIEAKDLEAAVVIPPAFQADLAAERPARITILFDSSVQKSEIAHAHVERVLREFDRGTVLFRLQKHGIAKRALEPLRIEDESVASREQEGRAFAALLLPYMLILMCFSGAIYPAIDLGAGEKERGTLETLLVSPASRTELVVGKFLVIFATSLLAAALNLGSLAFSFRSGLMPAIASRIPLSVDPLGAAIALVLMLPLAAIFAAVLLSVSIFAKSFKEAQAYFAPFNILIVIPAFFSAIPGVKLSMGFALVPIVNVSLAIKETLTGTYQWDCLAVILVSTVAIAAACIAFSASWFKREEVLFRS